MGHRVPFFMTTIFEKIYRNYYTSLYHNYSSIDTVLPLTPYRLKSSWTLNKEDNTEEAFEKNYGNLCSEVLLKRIIIKLEKNDDKISMKLFYYVNSRRVGKKFFRKSTMCKYVTYNLKTNILYHGEITNYHLKRKCYKKVRTSNFSDSPIQKFIGFFNTLTYGLAEYNLFTKDDIFNLFNLFLQNIPGLENYMNINSQDRLYKFILDKRGVKLPNNWLSFKDSPIQPKKVDYKKNDFKYIDALMNIHNLSGDKIRRVLHQVNSFNINTWNSVASLFGLDYLKTKNDNFIKEIFETSYFQHSEYFLPELFTKKELDNSFEIFKQSLLGDIDPFTFFDHIRFYVKLKGYGEKIKWSSRTYTEFNEEHLIWSDLYSSYTKGKLKRIYGQSFIDLFDTKIVLDDKYFPVILLTSTDYNNESAVQSNCVRTYVDRAASVIISLRKGSNTSDVRASIEYLINTDDNEKIKLKRIQTLGKYNYHLDTTWNEPIKMLDKMISNYLKIKVFDLPKLEKETKKGISIFNSEFVTTNEYAPEMGYYLKWDNSDVNNNCLLPYIDF